MYRVQRAIGSVNAAVPTPVTTTTTGVKAFQWFKFVQDEGEGVRGLMQGSKRGELVRLSTAMPHERAACLFRGFNSEASPPRSACASW